MNVEFTEKIMVKGMMLSKDYLTKISKPFEKEYFDNDIIGQIFEMSKDHLIKHNALLSKDMIIPSLKPDIREEAKELFEDISSIDFDVSKNFSYLVEKSDEYLKEKAMEKAIINSVHIMESGGDKTLIRRNIEEALCKDLTLNLGIDYFNTLSERLRKLFSAVNNRVPTCYSTFDEYINGGFPPYTLSVITAQIHGFKSTTMCNFAARQVLAGYNPVVMTLEMSEDEFARRFDSVYSKLDLNAMYISNELKPRLVKSLKEVKDYLGRGELFIKQFPTGAATVSDFRIYLRELVMRDKRPDILYVDYINLMKPELNKGKDLYNMVKTIAEELRALSFEFAIPVVSVSQLNRAGSFVSFNDIDFNYVAECIDLNTIVIRNNKKVKISDLKIGDKIDGSNGLVKVMHIWPKKRKKKYKIKTKSGKEIICSADHKFPTVDGTKSINTGLQVGNKLNSL